MERKTFGKRTGYLPTRKGLPLGFWLAVLACALGSFALVYGLNSGALVALLTGHG